MGRAIHNFWNLIIRPILPPKLIVLRKMPSDRRCLNILFNQREIDLLASFVVIPHHLAEIDPAAGRYEFLPIDGGFKIGEMIRIEVKVTQNCREDALRDGIVS